MVETISVRGPTLARSAIVLVLRSIETPLLYELWSKVHRCAAPLWPRLGLVLLSIGNTPAPRVLRAMPALHALHPCKQKSRRLPTELSQPGAV